MEDKDDEIKLPKYYIWQESMNNEFPYIVFTLYGNKAEKLAQFKTRIDAERYATFLDKRERY